MLNKFDEIMRENIKNVYYLSTDLRLQTKLDHLVDNSAAIC